MGSDKAAWTTLVNLVAIGTGLRSICRFQSKIEQVVPEETAQDSTGADTIGADELRCF